MNENMETILWTRRSPRRNPSRMDTSEDAGVYVRRGDDLFFDKSRVNVLYSNGVFHDMDRNEAEKLFSEDQPAEGK